MTGWPVEPEDNEEGLDLLKKKILEERGLDTSQYKDKFLKRRVKARMRVRGIITFQDYISLLDRDPKEYILLFDKLTVNVTEFFRNPEMWKALQKKVFPEVLADPEEARIVRFWSAGCASGEEVYTLAMLVDQYLWNKDSRLQVVIRGTDLDEDALKKAREGRYPPDKLKKVPDIQKRLYFEKDGDGLRVNDKARALVRLARHDLIGGRKYKYFDVILCRNVIIYFSREQQMRLFEDFHNALNNDGFLIIGKTETLLDRSKDMFEVVDSHERIYRKKVLPRKKV